MERHLKHCYTLEVTVLIVSLEYSVVMKFGRTCTRLELYYEDWKLVEEPYLILIKWQDNAICFILVDNVYYFLLSQNTKSSYLVFDQLWQVGKLKSA